MIQAPHILNWRIICTLIIILFFSPEVFAVDVLLEDDFSGNLSDNWFLFGDPYNDSLNSWHRYKIILEPDMTVSFNVDSLLLHESNLEFPPDQGQLSVMIGDRSSSWGRVYHDNLMLTRP